MKYKKQKRRLDKSLLLKASLEKKDVFDYPSAAQLAANNIAGLLPFSLVEENNERPVFYYDITGLMPLATFLKAKLSLSQWRSMLEQFILMLDAIHVKGFQDRNLLLDLGYVYLSLDDFAIQFAYLPLAERTPNERALVAFLTSVAQQAMFLLDDDKEQAEDLINFLKLQSVFSLVDLKNYLGVSTSASGRLVSGSTSISALHQKRRPGRDFIAENSGAHSLVQISAERTIPENIMVALSEDAEMQTSTGQAVAQTAGHASVGQVGAGWAQAWRAGGDGQASTAPFRGTKTVATAELTPTSLERIRYDQPLNEQHLPIIKAARRAAPQTGASKNPLFRIRRSEGFNKCRLMHRVDAREWQLIPGPTVIGRSKNSNIQLGDSVKVSRSHAIVVFEDGRCTVMDNDSSNGTFVNGIRLMPGQIVPLNDGDQIQLGDQQLIVRLEY